MDYAGLYGTVLVTWHHEITACLHPVGANCLHVDREDTDNCIRASNITDKFIKVNILGEGGRGCTLDYYETNKDILLLLHFSQPEQLPNAKTTP